MGDSVNLFILIDVVREAAYAPHLPQHQLKRSVEVYFAYKAD